jgi:hypothetical protein
MVVAVGAMRVVQVAVDQIIEMVAMGHGFVAAPGPMNMALGMAPDLMIPRASSRVFGIHFDHVLLDAIPLLVFQMTGLQVIRMPMMLNRNVAATRAVMMFFGNAHIRFR